MKGSHYFKIGIFLLLGLILIALTAVFLGLGVFIRGTRPAESYFSQSVEGLSKGSEVRFRGVTIGTVKSIGLVIEGYPQAKGYLERLVLVRMDLYEDKIRAFTERRPKTAIEDEIAKGLRVTVSVQLLTGEGSLQLDYLDPERNPVPPINWNPDTLYIPSAPSTIHRLEDLLVTFSNTLEDVNFEQLSKSINSLSQTVAQADFKELGRSVAETLEGVNVLVATMNDIVGDPRARRLIPKSFEILENIEQAAVNLRESSSVLRKVTTDPGFRQGLNAIPGILENARQASTTISQGAETLTNTARSLQALTGDQRRKIDSLLENLARAARNFEELSEEAQRNPSRFLFSEPPSRSPIDR